MQHKKEHYIIKNGDSVELIKEIADNSIHLSVFSPPFADLYTYSDSPADMGNSKNQDEFFTHLSYLTVDLNRVMMRGRIVAVHCMDLPIMKGKEGYIGLRDFSGMLIRHFEEHNFIYSHRVTLWKDPVIEMTRTKAIGLLNKQKDKDASLSRVGLPDYVLFFRKKGDNPVPITHSSTDESHPNYIPIPLWQKYASPVWMDIDYGYTLNGVKAREDKDEKHICPLQLQTIERCIHLWSNPGEIVFSPFAGIGSEGFQAIKMNRNFLGFELKKSYYQVAIRNLRNAILEKSQLELI